MASPGTLSSLSCAKCKSKVDMNYRDPGFIKREMIIRSKVHENVLTYADVRLHSSNVNQSRYNNYQFDWSLVVGVISIIANN